LIGKANKIAQVWQIIGTQALRKGSPKIRRRICTWWDSSFCPLFPQKITTKTNPKMEKANEIK
jgi:hypothetical protein